MEDSMKSKNSSPTDADSSGDKLVPRKPYQSPELVEYGSVAKLTQGTLSTSNDFKGGGFKSNFPCL